MKSTKIKCIPNVLTFCNMAIGILIICLMIHNDSLLGMRMACLLVYVSVVLDVLDGHLARHLDATSDMGKQLDSFADFITFGVAPIAIFLSRMTQVSWYVLLLLILYPLAGGFRLARYNLQEDCKCFKGLPITVAGALNVAVMFINSFVMSTFTPRFISIYLFLILFLAVLMVSNVKVKRIIQ